MEWLYYFISLVAGIILSAFYFKQKQLTSLLEINRLETENLAHQNTISELKETQKTEWRELTEKLVSQSSEKLEASSQKNISLLLNPLKDRIVEFEKKVSETYSNESRERFALQKEIEKIVITNNTMSLETQNLSKALRGNVKTQGNWGEVILDKLLSTSGLREGIEYTTQGRDLKLKDAHEKRLKPDVIIHLPENKHIIVDSKVSLLSYEKYCNSQHEDDKALGLTKFQTSVKSHVLDLSKKHYTALTSIDSPDFVFLFMPIEGAFLLAHQSDSSLFSFAWEHKVVIVGPSTLLPSLRTVASLWKNEHQNRNAMEIARQAGAMYDKFVGFTGDLEKINKSLDDAQKSYGDAINKLSTGRGNLVKSVEKLKALGAKTQKNLSEELTEDHTDKINF